MSFPAIQIVDESAVCKTCRRMWLDCHCASVPKESYQEYWTQRYRKYQETTVVRLGMTQEEMDQDTLYESLYLQSLIDHVSPDIQNKDPRHVFEFGCGWGRLLLRFKHNDWYTFGTDIEAEALRLARSHGLANVEQWNGRRTELHDGWADVAYTWTCLQHVEDSELPAIYAELERIVRPGGLLILTENTTERSPPKAWVKFRRETHYQLRFADAEFDHLGTIRKHDQGERHSTMIFRKREA